MYYLQNQIFFEHFFPGTSIFLLQFILFIYIACLYRHSSTYRQACLFYWYQKCH